MYFSKNEMVRHINETLALVEDRTRAEKLFNLGPDDFYPFMTGYLKAELTFVLDTINYDKK